VKKSELEKTAREFCFDNNLVMYDAVVGSVGPLLTGIKHPNPDNVKSFQAGARWALEWVQEESYGYGENVDIRSIESKDLEIEEDEKK